MVAHHVRTIGILTGGGDVPGLNPCIKQLVIRASRSGIRVLGIRKGWAGLLEDLPDHAMADAPAIHPLDTASVRTIDRSGGTILHTSRTNPAAVRQRDAPLSLQDSCNDPDRKQDLTARVLDNLSRLGIDLLIPIGGDDTLSFAVRLHQEGFPVIAIPKTMDNDVMGTDYCIGFSTAVTRSVNFIHALRTSAGSHERIAVVELFGRYCGETSLIAGYLSGADRVIISEVPFDVKRLADLLREDRQHCPSRYAMMCISEGATLRGGDMAVHGDSDAFGHRKLGGIGAVTADAIKKITGIDMIFQPLFYLMRSGSPDSLDLMVAMNYANLAVDLIDQGRSGYVTVLNQGCYGPLALDAYQVGAKRVDVDAFYDAETYRPRIREVDGKPMFLY